MNAENIEQHWESQFSLITSNLTIMLLPEIEKFFKGAKRTLQPSGILFFSVLGTIEQCSFFNLFY